MIAAMAMPSASNVIKRPEVGCTATAVSAAVVEGNNEATVLQETMPDRVINSHIEAKRGCNRCQDCTGYMATQDWRRSTCTKCRCPRQDQFCC